MQAAADAEDAGITIEPWDYLFYAEKVRKKKYALDQDELKAYFELDNMIAGSFFMAEQLYGITFTERDDIVRARSDGRRELCRRQIAVHHPAVHQRDLVVEQ